MRIRKLITVVDEILEDGGKAAARPVKKIAAVAVIRSRIDFEVDRHDVRLDDPIRSVGTHEVKVKLFHEVEPVITVEVITEG